jgi:hypothetical protein
MRDARLAFSQAELERYKEAAKFAFENKVTPRLSPVEQKTDMSVARKLDASPWPFRRTSSADSGEFE